MTEPPPKANPLPSTTHRPPRYTFLKRLTGGIVTATAMLLLIEGALRLVWHFAGSEARRDLGDPLAARFNFQPPSRRVSTAPCATTSSATS